MVKTNWAWSCYVCKNKRRLYIEYYPKSPKFGYNTMINHNKQITNNIQTQHL